MRCVALIAIRNGMAYLPRLLEHLAAQRVAAAIIDHGSEDGSARFCRGRLGREVITVESLDYDGTFSLRQQLQAKQALAERLGADWLIHQDVDELLQSPVAGETLSAGIARAAAAGANCINFDEFVFLPYPDEQSGDDPFGSRRYYFLQPSYPRLLRAWRHGLGLSNVASAGHRLQGAPLRRFDEDFILRHYPFTSQAHALRKYAQRRFADHEIRQGWHRKRRAVPPGRFRFPAESRLKSLPTAESVDFDRSDPRTEHYWHW